MTDDPANELVSEFAKELARQLPVKEALAPPARQTGQILEDIVKTIQLALVPFQLAGALQDRLRAFIDGSVRRIPEPQRVSPAPQILGPVIEAIRYEPSGTELDDMFSELLSSSMDQSRLKDAHPAFPSIIRALSSDEAKLLKSLAKNNPVRQISLSKLDRVRNLFEPMSIEAMQVPADIDYPGNARIYLEHLRQLGLVEISVTRAPEPIMEEGIQVAVRNFAEHQLSLWGIQFMRAVTKPDN
jgi:hypothetical protein